VSASSRHVTFDHSRGAALPPPLPGPGRVHRPPPGQPRPRGAVEQVGTCAGGADQRAVRSARAVMGPWESVGQARRRAPLALEPCGHRAGEGVLGIDRGIEHPDVRGAEELGCSCGGAGSARHATVGSRAERARRSRVSSDARSWPAPPLSVLLRVERLAEELYVLPLPEVSPATVRLVINALRDGEQIAAQGAGPSARWRRL